MISFKSLPALYYNNFLHYYYLFIYLTQIKDQPEHCMVWVFNAVSISANCQKHEVKIAEIFDLGEQFNFLP